METKHVDELKLKSAELEHEYWETKLRMAKREEEIHNAVYDKLNIDSLLSIFKSYIKHYTEELIETTDQNIKEK